MRIGSWWPMRPSLRVIDQDTSGKRRAVVRVCVCFCVTAGATAEGREGGLRMSGILIGGSSIHSVGSVPCIESIKVPEQSWSVV